MKETPISSLPGIPMLLALLAAIAAGAWIAITGGLQGGSVAQLAAGLLLAFASLFCLFGLYMVEPNQSAVISLFGKYVGTVKENGLRWNNPFFSKK
ncbi:MAG TPA: SPFH domain-containing protein, partial [Thermomonas sp.]|nr:SPFH domain-containing protein [Thermomonas sp.]